MGRQFLVKTNFVNETGHGAGLALTFSPEGQCVFWKENTLLELVLRSIPNYTVS